MAAPEVQARHVFHAETSGWDRIHAWQEATGEPVFVWGRHSGAENGRFFGSLKRAFNKWVSGTGGAAEMTVYHDGVGADAFGPLDPAPHKILLLHHWFSGWERHFEWAIRCTGKVMVGDSAQVVALRQRFGWIPERFIETVPQPLLGGLPPAAKREGPASQRTGIWLHGRPWRHFGNRLRAIVDRWDPAAGQLELIVGGSRQPGWANQPHVIWSAEMPLDFALHRLYTWDSTLLLNDTTLDAPWFLRALELGCFPLVPEGNSPARTPYWDEEAAPRPYGWGDTGAALELLQQWRSQKESAAAAFGGWTEGFLQQHATHKAFQPIWNQAKAHLLAQRVPGLRPRRVQPNWFPVLWYERMQRLRQGM